MIRGIYFVILILLSAITSAQKVMPSRANSLVHALGTRYLAGHPEAEAGKSGIIYVLVIRQSDSISARLAYSSYNSPSDRQLAQYRRQLNQYRSLFPDGYAVVLPVEFHIVKDGRSMPIRLKQKDERQLSQRLKGRRILPPVIEEGSVKSIPARDTGRR